jgi:hypothetical protein
MIILPTTSGPNGAGDSLKSFGTKVIDGLTKLDAAAALKANLDGAAFSGAISSPSITVTPTVNGGYISLSPGDTTHTGLVNFYSPTGRVGYIGYADDGGIYLSAEKSGSRFNFINSIGALEPAINSNPILHRKNSGITDRSQRVVDLVADFSAAGDGVVDDGPALQAAIDYVFGLGGGTVRIPPLKFGLGAPVYLRNNVVLEGVTAAGPSVFRCSTLRAIKNMDSMITQADMTQILHSAGLKRLHIDGGRDRGLFVDKGVYVSGVNCRFNENYIHHFRSYCFFMKQNAVAAWINWFSENYIEMANCGVLWQGTDSYIHHNYISTCTSYCMIIDSTGGNQVTGNMLDAAGRAFDDAAENVNGIALVMQNFSQKDRGPEWAQTRNILTGNHFGENFADISIPDHGSRIYSGHVITGNLFHNVQGNSITIGPNNRGGIICGNDFSDIGSGSVCVGIAANCPGWSLGPNSFSNDSFGTKYYVQTSGLSITGYQ